MVRSTLFAALWLAVACSRPAIVPDTWAEPKAEPPEVTRKAEPPEVTPERQAPTWQAFGPGLDLSGFLPVKTAVIRDGELEWLELESQGEHIRLASVPPLTSPPAQCVETSPPVYLGFLTTPRMRLALRAGQISLEREIGDCWVDVSPAPALKRGKTLRRSGPAATAFKVALGAVDRALAGVTLVLTGDQIELTRGDDTIASVDLDAAYFMDEGFDEEGGGTNRREVGLTPLHDKAKRLVALEVIADEGLTGSGSPIGGSREYARKLRWVVALDGEAAATASLVADVEGPYSGDGYTGSDDGHKEVWRRVFEGGAIVGTWSARGSHDRAPAAHILKWSIASLDELVELDLTLPTLDQEIRQGKKLPAAPSITEVVSSGLSFTVTPTGLTIVARERTTIPLFTAPAGDERVSAIYACTALVCRIEASAHRPAPDGEDEYGHPLTGASRRASAFVSRTTLQIVRL